MGDDACELLAYQEGRNMLTRRERGVSLVEIMIGVAISGMLLMAGIPGFTSWIQNSQNRTAAESVVNGLQLARVEAVKRNTAVRFQLTDASGLVKWAVGCVTPTADCPSSIQQRNSHEGATNARVGVSTTPLPIPVPSGYFSAPIDAAAGGAGAVVFNGMGRPSAGDVSRIDITNAASTSARRYVVTISAGGQVRMCDPALSLSSNPQGCS